MGLGSPGHILLLLCAVPGIKEWEKKCLEKRENPERGLKLWNPGMGWRSFHSIQGHFPLSQALDTSRDPRAATVSLGYPFQGGIPSQHFLLTPNLTQFILEFFPWLPLDVSQGQLLVWFGKFLLRRSPNKPRKRNGSWEVLIDFPDLQMKGRGETLCVNYGQNEGPKSPGSSGKKSFGERRTPFLWLQDHRENFSSRN